VAGRGWGLGKVGRFDFVILGLFGMGFFWRFLSAPLRAWWHWDVLRGGFSGWKVFCLRSVALVFMLWEGCVWVLDRDGRGGVAGAFGLVSFALGVLRRWSCARNTVSDGGGKWFALRLRYFARVNFLY